MGFLDKAREAAQQATTKAQQGLAQGQAKLDEVQTSRAADGLLRDLGTAYFAEQRTGGSHQDVLAALVALDAHVAANGPLGQTGPGSFEPASQSSWTPASPSATPPPPSATPPPPSAPPSATPPPPGGFTLDDL